MVPAMEHGIQPETLYHPQRFPGYPEALTRFAPSKHEPGTWIKSLASLHDQRNYLESQLCKTATTLDILRSRQTRNERALSTNPRPRAKKKKILQNRWLTDKNIKTCENDERVLVNNLQVCHSNIITLQTLAYSTTTSSTTAEYASCAGLSCPETASTNTDFDWNGWTDEDETSPFQKSRPFPVILDEVAPDFACERALAMDVQTKPPSLPLHISTPLPPPPPNTARAVDPALSPEAKCFEPVAVFKRASSEVMRTAVDKLSISGLLSSKHVQELQKDKRRFSEAAISHIFLRLAGHGDTRLGPPPMQRHASWNPELRPTRVDQNRNDGSRCRYQSV